MSCKEVLTFWLDTGAPMTLLSLETARLRPDRVARAVKSSARGPDQTDWGTTAAPAPRRSRREPQTWRSVPYVTGYRRTPLVALPELWLPSNPGRKYGRDQGPMGADPCEARAAASRS